jgi:hypothetical protein
MRGVGSLRWTARPTPPLFAAVALSAVVVTNLLNFGAKLRYPALSAGSASSWSHQADAAALALGAAICLGGAYRSAQRRAAWAGVAGILAFFFIDEVSSLHAQIDQLSYGKLAYAPLLLVLVACLSRLAIGAPHIAYLRTGLAMLLTSYLIHVLGPHLVSSFGWGSDSWPYQVRDGLKEGTELAGLLLAVGALSALVIAGPGRRSP